MFASFLARPSQSIELVDVFNYQIYASALSPYCINSKMISIIFCESWLVLPIIGQIMQLYMQMPEVL